MQMSNDKRSQKQVHPSVYLISTRLAETHRLVTADHPPAAYVVNSRNCPEVASRWLATEMVVTPEMYYRLRILFPALRRDLQRYLALLYHILYDIRGCRRRYCPYPAELLNGCHPTTSFFCCDLARRGLSLRPGSLFRRMNHFQVAKLDDSDVLSRASVPFILYGFLPRKIFPGILTQHFFLVNSAHQVAELLLNRQLKTYLPHRRISFLVLIFILYVVVNRTRNTDSKRHNIVRGYIRL